MLHSDVITEVMNHMKTATGAAFVSKEWWAAFTSTVEYLSRGPKPHLLAARCAPEFHRFFTDFDIYLSGNAAMFAAAVESAGVSPSKYVDTPWGTYTTNITPSPNMVSWLSSNCSYDSLVRHRRTFIRCHDVGMVVELMKTNERGVIYEISLSGSLGLFRDVIGFLSPDSMEYVVECAFTLERTDMVTFLSYLGVEFSTATIWWRRLHLIRAISPSYLIKYLNFTPTTQ